MFYHLYALFYNRIYIEKLPIDENLLTNLLNFSDRMKDDDVPAEIIKASSK